MTTKENWDRLADFDALWTVLTDPAKKGGKWDPAEFFATGRVAVDQLMQRLVSLGISVRRDQALDFGCGVGRLTQGLSHHFRHVVGVDISSSMIAQAEGHNAAGRPILFVLGNEQNLPLADGSTDFVFSLIVLQHIPRALQDLYLGEFLRVLRPGGVAVFQIPSRHVQDLGSSFYGEVDTARGVSRIELHCNPRDEVVALLAANGGQVLHVEPDTSVGPQFESYLFFVRKETSAAGV